MGKRPTKEQFNRQLEQIAGALRDDIANGRYAPGDYLPTERALMERFRMSNNAVRTALEQLVREGWIEKEPRVGNKVAAGKPHVKLTIVLSDYTQRNLELSGLLDDFQRQYSWIRVEPRIKRGGPPDVDGKQEEQADLVLMDDFQFQRLVEDEGVASLEPLAVRKDIYPQLNGLFQQEGRQYLCPVFFSPVVLCYNKAHFRELGLNEPDGSWDWERLVECAEQLSDGKGRYGFNFFVQSMNRWPLFLLQSGEPFEWDDAGRLKDIRGTALLQSMKVCKRIIHNRKAFPLFLSEDDGDIMRMFEEGKLSMVLTSYMGLNLWKDAKLDYDIAPVPFIHEPRTLVICCGVGISANSRHKEEAMLLADYLASDRAREHIYRNTLSVPSTQPLPARSANERINRPERYGLFREMMFSYRSHKDLNIPIADFAKLSAQLKAYWAEMIDEDELCDRLRDVLSASKGQ